MTDYVVLRVDKSKEQPGDADILITYSGNFVAEELSEEEARQIRDGLNDVLDE